MSPTLPPATEVSLSLAYVSREFCASVVRVSAAFVRSSVFTSYCVAFSVTLPAVSADSLDVSTAFCTPFVISLAEEYVPP